jgi:hypothetical protein
MQPPCSVLSLVTKAGFTVMTRRQSKIPPNGKVQTHREENERQMESKVKSMLIISFDIKGIVHKEFVLTDQTVNTAYFCDISLRLRENVLRLRPELWRQ